jgi:ribose/xylose/arabinose/galactoside ABC-type transport system permease subunit
MTTTLKTNIPGQPAVEQKGTRISLRRFLTRESRALSSLAFFVLMMLIFMALKPSVFLHAPIYGAVLISLPTTIIIAVSLVFVVASGEIDVSFGGSIVLAGLTFAKCVAAHVNPILAIAAAIGVGILIGLANGFLVTRLKLSSMVITLGMLFLTNGVNFLITNGSNVDLIFLDNTLLSNVFIKKFSILGLAFPAQMFWGIGFAIVGWLLFNRHRFGAHICCVGDNPDSAREMGINVALTKTLAFVIVGVASALVGIISCLVSHTFYPSIGGEGWLLSGLAALYVGGTPPWGGVGTIVGTFFGASTIAFINTGVMAAGGSGFYLQFFYGVIMIISLVGQRFNRSKSRY